jgi:GNAT superfamily N-acetyltransferase
MAMRKYPFDCGVEDLNSFFDSDIEKYDRELIAKTFILTPVGVRLSRSNPPLAFISFCNDAIRRDVVMSEMGGTKSQWKKIVSLIPHNKQYKALPAVKIARLGVQQNVKSRGLGTQLLNMTKQLFLTDNRTGCRFLTVDSYITEQAIHFYEKNYFQFFTQSEKEKCFNKLRSDFTSSETEPETVAMYYDLRRTLA